MAYRFVDTPEGLQEVADALKGAERLYLDTEFESNRSGTRLCLVQVTTDEGEIYLIDSVALWDMSCLAPAFTAPGVEWVLHAGKQDLALLCESIDVDGPPLIFDTQTAWGLLSAEAQVGLAYLQLQVLDVRGSKGHQTADWLRRPLPEAQLDYAASDVEHLPELRRILGERLAVLDRLQCVYDASAEVNGDAPPRPEPLLSMGSFRNAWQLDGPGLAVLQWMIRWFNSLSMDEKLRAPKRKALLAIAARQPETRAELLGIKGVPRGWGSREGTSFTRAIAAAARGPVPDSRPTARAYGAYDSLWIDAWLSHLRAELAQKLEVSPELAMPGWIMKAVKSHIEDTGDYRSAVDHFTGWRQRLVKAAYLSFCNDTLPAGG